MTRLIAAALFTLATASSQAAVMVVPGIPAFDTSLGTLTSATVSIDPPPMLTGTYTPSFFETIDNHVHFLAVPNVTVPGLATFSFTTVTTSAVNPGMNDPHNHTFNIASSAQTFSGAGLAWFLNPANGVATVTIPSAFTSIAEDHFHDAMFQPVTPTTTFVFNPVPEPMTAVLAVMAFAASLRCRR